ncbi:MAG: hypothetical protein SF162_09375 [bacterium]|nr:hypothetical protein [bacterium]
MRSRRTLIVIGVIVLIGVVAAIIAATAAFTPAATEPAFQVALQFAEAIGRQDNLAAQRTLHPTTREWVIYNCPNGQIATCLNTLIPDEWGAFQSVVFRRATPDNTSWDVDLIATYAEGVGFSGVCIYVRMERLTDGQWVVAGWAGWIHCGDERSRNMARNLDAPNRAP